MKRWGLVFALMAAACGEPERQNYDVLPRPPPDDWAQLRVLNVAAGVPALDVYLRDTTQPVLASLAEGFAQGFIEVAARDYTIDLRLAAASPNAEVRNSYDISLASRERVTLVLYGDMQFLRFTDDLARVDVGAMRVVNATTTGPVSFDLNADGTVEVAGLASGEVGRATLPGLDAALLSVAADAGAQTYQLPPRPVDGTVVIVVADSMTLMLTYSFSVTKLAPP